VPIGIARVDERVLLFQSEAKIDDALAKLGARQGIPTLRENKGGRTDLCLLFQHAGESLRGRLVPLVTDVAKREDPDRIEEHAVHG
jgi:hypothetical protein